MSTEDERDQLDAYLAGDDPPPDGDMDELTVESREHASRELLRLARLDREAAQVQAVYDDQKARLDRYLADRMSGIESRRSWLTAGLERFMRSEKARGGPKSLVLPGGRLQIRKRQALIDANPAGLDDLARSRPSLVQTTYRLDKVAAKGVLSVGPLLDAQDPAGEYEFHAAVDTDGAVVSDLTFMVPRDPEGFSVTLDSEDGDL